MKLAACAVALVFVAGMALAGSEAAMTVEEEARALIGVEFLEDTPSVRISPDLSCTSQGGGFIAIDGIAHDDWAMGFADCQGRSVLLLERWLGRQERGTKWRVVDAVVLPPYETNPGPKRLNAWRLLGGDQCEIKGRPNTAFLALVRFGKRKEVDWRTGVKAGWTFDLEAGRIVPLSTRDVVCEWVEP